MGRRQKTGGEEENDEKEEAIELEEIRKWTREALSKTGNSSGPGPDGISYTFIKLILKTILG